MTCSTTTAAAPDGSGAPGALWFRILHQGWGRFGVVRLRLADGFEIEREIKDHGDAVAVLPYDPERREALLVRQLRAPALVCIRPVPQVWAAAPGWRFCGARVRRVRPLEPGLRRIG